MKKFLAAFVVLSVIVIAPASQVQAATFELADSYELSPMTTGESYWARVVNCNEWISLREYPSTEAPRLAKIPLGAIVKIFKYNAMDRAHPSPYNGFYSTNYNGMRGWCLMDYLRIEEYAEAIP